MYIHLKVQRISWEFQEVLEILELASSALPRGARRISRRAFDVFAAQKKYGARAVALAFPVTRPAPGPGLDCRGLCGPRS